MDAGASGDQYAMPGPYRNELEALRAENARLRDENAQLHASNARNGPVGGWNLGASWVLVACADLLGGVESRSLLNTHGDAAVYGGAAIAIAMVAVTTWQLVRTFRGVGSKKE